MSANTNNSAIHDLPVNQHHVIQQFNRRPTLAGARFLLDEIATRMIDRLQYIKLQPKTLVDVGCGPALRTDDLIRQYPKAQIYGLDSNKYYIEEARQAFSHTVWQSVVKNIGRVLSGHVNTGPQFICADMAQSNLPAQSMDLVWSNLALHWHPQPHAVIAEWQRLIRAGGLVMFSCFGPNTLSELRQAVVNSGWHTRMLPFVDMHDFGDLLLENSFMDPVMDQETITLTYKTPQKLLTDVAALGGNPTCNRHAGLMGKGSYYKLCEALEQQRDANGLIRLSFEVAYGHAWRNAVTKKGQETRISIDSIGRANRDLTQE